MYKKILLIIILFWVCTISFISVFTFHSFAPDPVVFFLGALIEISKNIFIFHIHRTYKKNRWHVNSFFSILIFSLMLLTAYEAVGFFSVKHFSSISYLEINDSKSKLLEEEKDRVQKIIKEKKERLSHLSKKNIKKYFIYRKNFGIDKDEKRVEQICSMLTEIKNVQAQKKHAPDYSFKKITGFSVQNFASQFIFFIVIACEFVGFGLIAVFSTIADDNDMHIFKNVHAQKNVQENMHAQKKTCMAQKKTCTHEKPGKKKYARNEMLKNLMKSKSIDEQKIMQIAGKTKINTVNRWLNNETPLSERAWADITRSINKND